MWQELIVWCFNDFSSLTYLTYSLKPDRTFCFRNMNHTDNCAWKCWSLPVITHQFVYMSNIITFTVVLWPGYYCQLHLQHLHLIWPLELEHQCQKLYFHFPLYVYFMQRCLECLIATHISHLIYLPTNTKVIHIIFNGKYYFQHNKRTIKT